MDEPLIKLAIDESLATITLNRPSKLNTLTPAMLVELEKTAAQLEQDLSVRVVTIPLIGVDTIKWHYFGFGCGF